MNKTIFLLACLYVCLASSWSLVQATKYSVCDQDKLIGEVSNVVISDCETQQDACPFLRGFNKSIELDFKPKQKIDVVKIKVAGKLKTLPVPFHINPDNACGNYGFDCPLEPNKTYKLKMSMPILRTYPKISVDVIMRLLDGQEKVIACVEMPAKIQEPEKPTVAAPAA